MNTAFYSVAKWGLPKLECWKQLWAKGSEYPIWQRSLRSSPKALMALTWRREAAYSFQCKRKDGVRYTMRNPENVLNSLRKHSAVAGYTYDRLYRNLYNRDFFLQAYQNIYANEGNMTAGTDGKTIDAMSIERIDRLIEALKDESYQPNPSRRTYIPKKNGKLRPLGIASIDDKLVQEVVHMLLEAVYENSFEDSSHGFRPNRSCHTALRQVQNRFTRCKWFVEGDIKSFFDNINHNILIGILRKKIKDERFLRLIRKFLSAGYMEEMKLHETYSGAVQGGIISPILANIYLDQLDKYMAQYKNSFDKGKKRSVLKSYTRLSDKRHGLIKKLQKTQTEEERSNLLEEIRRLDKIHKSMPYTDPMDSSFRRLQYVRYADDFIIGIIGSKQVATVVKEDIGKFLSEKLCLELSDEKTLITKATEKARFLSFDIRATPQSNHTKKTKRGITARNYGGHIMLEVPTPIIQKKLLELGAMEILVQNGTEVWKPVYRGALTGRTDLSILDQYNGEIRGFCNYYSIANNRSKLHKFRYIMEYSMYKTYACKYRTTKRVIIKRYRIDKDFGVKFQDKYGKERVRLLWKGSLARKDFPLGQEADIIHKPKGILKKPTLAVRLQSGRCEWCGKDTNALLVHQVRSLKELSNKEAWAVFMKQINRKTLIVCESCHAKIHSADCE